MNALETIWHRHKDLIKIFTTVVLVGGVAFYLVEGDAQDNLTIEDSLWWSLMTTTTVGTADFEPRTWQGRWLITAPITVASVAFLANLFSKMAKHHVKEAFQEQQDAMLALQTKQHAQA